MRFYLGMGKVHGFLMTSGVSEEGDTKQRGQEREIFSGRWRTLAVSLLILLVCAAVGVPAASAQSTLDTCTVIDSTTVPDNGVVELTSDITTDQSSCITVEVGGVTLEGQGHTIDGVNDEGVGISVTSSNGGLTNVNVRNVTVTNWSEGILYDNVSDGSVENVGAVSNENGIQVSLGGANSVRQSSVERNDFGVILSSSTGNDVTENTVSGNTQGVVLVESTDNVVTKNTVNDNVAGIGLSAFSDGNEVTENTVVGNENVGVGLEDSDNNELARNTVRDSELGVFLDESSGNILSNNTVRENTGLGVGIEQFSNDNLLTDNLVASNGRSEISIGNGSENNEVERLDIGDSTEPKTMLSFSGRGVRVANVTRPPADPTDQTSIGRYIRANATASTDSFLNLTFEYEDADVSGVDETALTVWRHDQGGWAELGADALDTTSNEVRYNATRSELGGVLAPLSGTTSSEFFEVNITGTNSPVDESDVLEVAAEVVNTGNEFATQNVTLVVDGQVVNSTSLSLDIGEPTTEVFEWQTADGDAGDHTATVASEDDSATQTVTVEPTGTEPSSFDVDVVDTNSPVVEGEDLTVTANVTNSGGQDTQGITLTDFNGLERDATSVALGQGESREVPLTWSTEVGDNGTGDVSVSSDNKTVTETVTVEEGQTQTSPEFSVSITEVDEPVTEGRDLTVGVLVENLGAASGTEEVRLLDFGGRVVDRLSPTLDGGESRNVTMVWETEIGDNGTGQLTVETQNATDTASATVRELTFREVDVDFSVTPRQPNVNDTITLRSRLSNPDLLDIAERTWNIQETGENLTGERAQPTIGAKGNYTVTHTVTDEFGRISEKTETLRIRGPPERVDMNKNEPNAADAGTVTVEESLVADMPEMDVNDQMENRMLELRVSVERRQTASVSMRRDDDPLRNATEPDNRESLGYLDINHSFDNSAVEEAGFKFEVEKDRLQREGVSPEDVVLQRYDSQNDVWETYDAELAGETIEAYEYWGDTPGMSVFSVSVPDSSGGGDDDSGSGSTGFGSGSTLFSFSDPTNFSLSDLTASVTGIQAGDTVEFSGTVEVAEGPPGNAEIDLVVGDDEVDTKNIDVSRGSPVTFTFEHVFEESGEYDVYIKDEFVETVVVSGEETEGMEGEGNETTGNTTDEDTGEEGTDEETQDGTEEAVDDGGVSDGIEDGGMENDTDETENASSDDSGDEGLPGFTVLAALVALVLGSVYLRGMRQD